MKTIKYTAIIMLLAAAALTAQKMDYSGEPGYINFGDFSELKDAELVTEVMIEDNLLSMVAKMAGHKDEELADLLSGLKLIRVHEFEVDKSSLDTYTKKFEDIDSRLNSKGWSRIVMSKQKDEYANVYIKTTDDENIDGLAVTTYNFHSDNTGEVVFVNIVGRINLETIGKLSGQFDIPHLEKVNNHEEENHK